MHFTGFLYPWLVALDCTGVDPGLVDCVVPMWVDCLDPVLVDCGVSGAVNGAAHRPVG